MQISARPNAKSISNGEWARFIFISGRLCVDFTQAGGETGKRAAWERFHVPSDLADWFAASPLRGQEVYVQPDELRTALSLRESIWRVTEGILQSEAPSAEDVGDINRVAAAPDLPPQLALEGLEHVWGSPATASAALSLIARDAIALFSGELRSRIRLGENPNCGLVFADASRPGQRRWCLMNAVETWQRPRSIAKRKDRHDK
jgi:predicted RNA-binding Zn ribbon-like protein